VAYARDVRPPAELDDVDWNAFPGPTYFRADDIPRALRQLDSPSGDRHQAGSACAFAYGNDHAGTLYPAAPHAVPFLAWFVAHGRPWARMAAAAALEDGIFFCGDHEFPTTITAAGDAVAVEDAFRAAIRAEVEAILAAVDTPETRSAVGQLLAAIADVESASD
jgi:hypothetical protein